MSEETKWALGLMVALVTALMASLWKHYVDCAKKWNEHMKEFGGIKTRQEDVIDRLERIEQRLDNIPRDRHARMER